MRVLIFGMTENPGGVESFIMNYYRHIDREKIQFDFLCNSHNPVAYEDELIKLGGRTFHIAARSQNYRLYQDELKQVFDEHAKEWDAIWVNVCSLANIDYLKMAKKYGIKRRIIHSHNSQNMDGKIRVLLHKLNRRRIKNIATDYWACSEDAANWFYSGETLQKTIIIHNAIDVDRLRFDEGKRDGIRKHYGLENQYVIGNIGRLHFQKNQTFCLDIFAEYQKTNPKSTLVLVGQGEDEQQLKAKANELGIKDKVLFAGVQKDIQAWLSSFDLFLFPSLFEGLSVVALEAQANCIPALASEGVIPAEVKMCDGFNFLELNKGAEEWSKSIIEMSGKTREEYEIVKKNFVMHGYDIETEVHKLEDLLLRNSRCENAAAQ